MYIQQAREACNVYFKVILFTCRKEQDFPVTWRQSIRDSGSENDRLLSLLELVCGASVQNSSMTHSLPIAHGKDPNRIAQQFVISEGSNRPV